MSAFRRYRCPFCGRHTLTAWGIKRHLLRPRPCEIKSAVRELTEQGQEWGDYEARS